MKKSGGIVSSTPFTKVPERRWRGLLSPMGKVKRRRLRRKKGSQPRLAALGSPFQGKGLAWILPPSYGRRCPEGAEVGWGKRYERERGRSSQVRRLREHPSAAARSPFPNGEGCETRMPLSPYQSLPRGRRGALSISHSQISIYP